jgi:hypothetical protein
MNTTLPIGTVARAQSADSGSAGMAEICKITEHSDVFWQNIAFQTEK